MTYFIIGKFELSLEFDMKIIPKFINVYDECLRRITPNSHYDYKKQFYKAIKKTKRLNLDIPEIKLNTKNEFYPNKNFKKQIFEIVCKNVMPIDPRVTHANCIPFTKKVQTVLKNELNLNTTYTVGSIINQKNRKVFYESIWKIKYRLNNKAYKTNGIKLHTWLTFPDLTIFDLTIQQTLINPEVFIPIFIDPSNQIKPNFSYFPILIGSDIFNKIEFYPIQYSL